MKELRFAIMGAGNIAHKFCDAVERVENCRVTAVASKSMDRASRFAGENKGLTAYDSYEKMLQEEKPDCVYIAVTPDAHFELCMLCLDYRTPVLCEKAMFLDSAQAKAVFDRSQKERVFVMEAMWSRFLPAIQTAKQWLMEGRIGKPVFLNIDIGFCAPKDPKNRYYNRELGGGAAHDLTVYAYELALFFLGEEADELQVQAVWGESGVDLFNHIALRFGDVMASLNTSFTADLEEKLVLYGEKGSLTIPHPHYGNEVILQVEGRKERFMDETPNGFVYEIQEVMDCLRKGNIESTVVPHRLTIGCAKLFDRIENTRY